VSPQMGDEPAGTEQTDPSKPPAARCGAMWWRARVRLAWQGSPRPNRAAGKKYSRAT
jgi:hypothetical protein